MTMGEEEARNPQEHPFLVFILVAGAFLGALFLCAQLFPVSDNGSGAQAQTLSRFAQGSGSAPLLDNEAATAPLLPAAAAEVVAPAAVVPPEPAPAPPPGIPTPPQPLSPPPAVSASSYAIIERSCGNLAFGHNEHERLPPASLTKIFSALVVASYGQLDEMAQVNVSGSQMAKRGSSVMGVEPYMRLSVIDLLYGLFLPSGNDAALVLANHIGGGDDQRFVAMMNGEVARLGLQNTYFTNPHGLDNPGLYSSAYDMALAGRAFLDVPLLFQVSTARQYTPNWAGGPLLNGNRLLRTYPGAFGVKIGYTRRARQTIVAAAERGGRQLILSVFGSEDRYAASAALFDWAFANVPDACQER
jgi:D-alanyl-D-alanine carboxypeptidase